MGVGAVLDGAFCSWRIFGCGGGGFGMISGALEWWWTEEGYSLTGIAVPRIYGGGGGVVGQRRQWGGRSWDNLVYIV